MTAAAKGCTSKTPRLARGVVIVDVDSVDKVVVVGVNNMVYGGKDVWG